MKQVLPQVAHWAAYRLSRSGHDRFARALGDVRRVQESILKRQLAASAGSSFGRSLGVRADMSLEQFQAAIPLTEYDDWRAPVERQRAGEANVLSTSPCQRYQPTSGSTSKVKWIPYSAQFLDELNAAIEPWICDLYRLEPRLRRGRHYWSLSWVPSDLRETIDGNVNDDMALLPLSKRLFMALTSAVPPWVAYTPSSNDSVFASLCQLAASDDLSMISVWSPTFLLNLLEQLSTFRGEVGAALRDGDWGARRVTLGRHDCPRSARAASLLRDWDGRLEPEFLRELWPRLGLLSAWDTSTSTRWAAELKQLFPDATFQGKGLMATEGVVTIPYRGAYPLAVTSHFYEFIDLQSGDVLPAWKLREGQEVRPVMTTGSGFLRYAMRDRLQVSGFMQQCPTFVFMGRLDGIDMVGEKLSPGAAEAAMGVVASEGRLPLSLLAMPDGIRGGKPFYLMLCEGEEDPVADAAAGRALEAQLREHFHYNLARDLGQLGAARCVTLPEGRKVYQYRGEQRGMVAGDMKLEPLVLWNCALHPAFERRAEEIMAA